MSKLKNFSATLGTYLVFSMFMTNVHGFDGPTHKYVTETSLSILHKLGKIQKDGKTNEFEETVVAEEISKTENTDEIQENDVVEEPDKAEEDGKVKEKIVSKYSDFYTDKITDIILEYCEKPDTDEIDGGFKWHFYNPATELNFMGERESALTRFINHYNAAIINYNTGHTTEAFQEFGRSLHFVEDLSTPVHTNYESLVDAGIKLSMHVEFEKRCIAVQDTCVAAVKQENLKYYLDNTKKIIGKTCAYLSADLFYSLEHELLPQDTIAEYAVLNAQKVVVGLLNRFYSEVAPSSNSRSSIKADEKPLGEVVAV
ncbi:MAG: hypothetical protein LBR79_01680 [Oscillospiraceae bacterium]|jgi:hypothetical protein|nr:hypothetical protein [Oscillospiraceae bacterium]